MIQFTLYVSECKGNLKNCVYPHQAIITDKVSMQQAVKFDHVTATYKDNYRSNSNFIEADNVPLDCDNDHSDNPKDWVTSVDVALAFSGVPFVIVYSRNHMKAKGTKCARPRFHVYFMIPKVTDQTEYVMLKQRIAAAFPYFDTNAMDSARLLFGTDSPEVEIYDGEKLITEYLDEMAFADWDSELEQVPEGKRNSTMSHLAGKLIKRFGNTEDALTLFLKEAEKCNPPLEENELQTIWESAVKFGRKVEKQEGYISPKEYNEGYNLKPDDYSDIGQAKVLSHEYAGELVFTDSTDYMRYKGTHWVESKQLSVGACEEFLDLQLKEANVAVEISKKALVDAGVSKELVAAGGKTLEKAIDGVSEKAFKNYQIAMAYRTFVMKRRDMKYVISALQAAKPMLLKNIKDFDSNEFLLNTPKGTYDLKSGISKEHCADDFITKITAVSPSYENRSLWLNTLDNFFCKDAELIEYVKEIVGLAAIGKVYQEALVIAYGEGSNGKSTFWNTIARVLGTYSGTISADALTVGCKRNVKPEMAELKGKRLVIAAELEEGMRLNTSMVKQLCSTDEVSAEKKYKDPFDYIPTHTLVLYTNHLPRVGANDDGTWRRLIIIPFNAKIERRSDVKNYSDYLVTHAGGAILAWIIEGAKTAIDNNFKLKEPEIVKEALQHYRSNNDWLSIFIEDCCELDESYSQKSGEFYQEYRAYCSRSGEYARSTTDFYTGIEQAGFERKTIKHCRYVLGIRLKSEFL